MDDFNIIQQDYYSVMSSVLRPQKPFSSGKYSSYELTVSYISDIHLDTHISIHESIKKQICRIANQLYASKGGTDVVLFGGDIAEDPKIAELFYHQFMLNWQLNEFRKWKKAGGSYKAPLAQSAAFKEWDKQIKLLSNKLHLEKKRISKWFKYTTRHVEMDENSLVQLLKKKNLPDFLAYYIKKIKNYENELNETQTRKPEIIAKLMAGEQYKILEGFHVYAVLGNHDMISFQTVEIATQFYNRLFKKERIIFLNNNGCMPSKFRRKYVIIGGVGFAKYNQKYNCTSLIGPKVMTRDEEFRESEKLFAIYQKALVKAIESHIPLIVLSHYPVKDWLPEAKLDCNCYYFTGHTHRNESIHTGKLNVFADNQIGYTKKCIEFRTAYLGLCYNPFINYDDGAFEITLEQYEQFYLYSGESMMGTWQIKKQIDDFNAIFYMVKESGFFGFFLGNQKTGMKICSGGTIKNIGKIDIDYVRERFSSIVQEHVKHFVPLRRLEEEISGKVKEYGFDGTIHGLIIDVDFYNHIMIDPVKRKIMYYYSPTFGIISEYNSFQEIISISSKNREIGESEHISAESLSLINIDALLEKQQKSLTAIDIKNSAYSYSRNIRQIQRLFDANILRVWDEDLLQGEPITLE